MLLRLHFILPKMTGGIQMVIVAHYKVFPLEDDCSFRFGVRNATLVPPVKAECCTILEGERGMSLLRMAIGNAI